MCCSCFPITYVRPSCINFLGPEFSCCDAGDGPEPNYIDFGSIMHDTKGYVAVAVPACCKDGESSTSAHSNDTESPDLAFMFNMDMNSEGYTAISSSSRQTTRTCNNVNSKACDSMSTSSTTRNQPKGSSSCQLKNSSLCSKTVLEETTDPSSRPKTSTSDELKSKAFNETFINLAVKIFIL